MCMYVYVCVCMCACMLYIIHKCFQWHRQDLLRDLKELEQDAFEEHGVCMYVCMYVVIMRMYVCMYVIHCTEVFLMAQARFAARFEEVRTGFIYLLGTWGMCVCMYVDIHVCVDFVCIQISLICVYIYICIARFEGTETG